MIGENQDAVGRTDLLIARLHGLQGVPADDDRRDVRIGIRQLCAALPEPVEDLERRRLPGVADPPLVRDAEREDPGAVEATSPLIEGLRDQLYDIAGHGPVDLVGQVDEPRLVPVQAHLPREVEGVDGDTVAADPRTRIEGKEAERLRGGGLDDLARVDAQSAAHERELVRQRDVDVPEHVLVELGELRDLRAGDLDHLVDDLPVEERRHLAAGPSDSADDLGDLPNREPAVSGVDALRREGEEEALAAPAPTRLEEREKQLLGRARVRRRLQDDQLDGSEPSGYLLRRDN